MYGLLNIQIGAVSRYSSTKIMRLRLRNNAAILIERQGFSYRKLAASNVHVYNDYR
jgi:hypothetical protein